MMLRLALALLTALVCLASFAQSRYVAEVKIYVDRSGVKKWKDLLGKTQDSDLRAAADVLFDEMNVIFQTLQPNIALQLRLKDLVLLDKNVFQRDSIYQGSAVADAGNFISNGYKKGDYDAAMLFTGADITAGYKAYGASYYATACTKLATGTTEIFTGRTMAIMTAHEIAHILGAPHDESCPSGWWSYGHLMNTVTRLKSSNSVLFSYCSKTKMYENIYKLIQADTNCLEDSTGPVTPDEVCKDVYGDLYSLNRGKYNPANYGDEFCEKLHCVARIDKKFQFKSQDMPDRMSCGRKKRCSNKKCVEADDGDYKISDSCPFGDQPLSDWGYTTMCPKRDCTKSNWTKYCCKSCEDNIEFGK